ncbi:MAG TPA: hypothetical protein IGS53_04075 [Leptolyngbyaceae cyanobacterium M33_DOE_097]|uniref:Uncharacterized protein n=1 Tax=Oscillatoriales cyanobacterium SpSt-418 TaxID=2282169 RepID=A0A7C3PDZ7_9CYAN|nr:hypothetical protein [Leptolyngbyaceae cyanobacterium M33_DOE_097]
MNSASSMRQTIQYPAQTVQRADCAMRCSPFYLKLFELMMTESISLKEIAGLRGVNQLFTRRSLSEIGAENELLWLIQVGLLRREVDGQGLTDSFRVTPLGRQLVHRWRGLEHTKDYRPTWIDRLYNAWQRWFRLPL